MHFVKTEELKTGMRLARPIYNKKSILLFDRNSLLSVQAIESIRNFGLIGDSGLSILSFFTSSFIMELSFLLHL
jgi:hypothetical protein